MIIESCIGEEQRTLYVSGAFGVDPELPQLLADVLDRDILVVDESHLPAIGAAAMCREVLDGQIDRAAAGPPRAPRAQWRDTVSPAGCSTGGMVRRHRHSSAEHARRSRRRHRTTVPKPLAAPLPQTAYQEYPYDDDPAASLERDPRPRTRDAATAAPTGLIYVSRLLTDRAMEHLRSLGAPAGSARRRRPSRAELEAGIAGASAAVITLTERVDADLLAAAGPQLKVIANVAVGFDNIDLRRGRRCGGDRDQHPRRPRPGHRRPHVRADPRRHPPHHRG